MENPKRRKWNQQGKREAVIDVLTYLMSKSEEYGQQCVESDAYARKLFEEPLLGNIDVPNNVRLVFVATGESEKKDAGSVVIELPRSGGSVPTDDNPMLVRYPKDFLQGLERKWDKFGKVAAIRDVLDYIMSHPEVGQRCLENDDYVRRLFRDQGLIEVPAEVKAIFVPSGEEESKEFGSLVIELPKPGPVPEPNPNPEVPHPLLGYVLCCYNLWKRNQG